MGASRSQPCWTRLGVVGDLDQLCTGHRSFRPLDGESRWRGIWTDEARQQLRRRSLLCFSVGIAGHQVGVDAQRDVVHEYLAVDLSQVDDRFVCGSEGIQRLPTGSSRSIPKSRARWLRVPAGTQTNASPCSAATSATTAWDPSPPAIPKASAPPEAACSARALRSSPSWNTTASRPRRRASSTSCRLTTFPSPDFGFMITTPCVADGTGYQRRVRAASTSQRSAAVPKDAATAIPTSTVATASAPVPWPPDWRSPHLASTALQPRPTTEAAVGSGDPEC